MNSIGKSNGIRLSRRTFTKLSALGTAAALSGISSVSVSAELEGLIAPASASPEEAGVRLIKSNCTHCAVGCGFHGRCENGVCTGIEPWLENPINTGSMCSKGTSISEILNSELRLKHPMKKTGGQWVQITWAAALDEIANKMKEIQARDGPDSIMYIGSAKTSNESCYLFRKFAAFNGTNNVDHQARICHSTTVAGLANTWSYGAMTNPWNDMRHSGLIMFFGENAAESHPVAMLHILEAKRRGAKFIVCDPRFTKSAAAADQWVRFRSGTDIALLWAIANVIVNNNWHNTDFIEKRTYGFDQWWDVVKNYTPEVVEDITWVPAATIRQLAYDWAHPPQGEGTAACICWAMGATQHTVGTNNIRAMACLELLCGHVGKPGGGTNAFRGHDNVQGSTDMCVLSHWLPAYYGLTEKAWRHWVTVWNMHEPITYEELKAKFAEHPAGSGNSLMHVSGITVSRWYEGVLNREYPIAQPNPIKMVFVWGHSLNSITEMKRMKEAMEKVELLVGVDPHATIAASLADRPDGIIILPASTQFEQEGSCNNSSRETQWRNKIVEPLYESRPDGWIIRELANRLGFGAHFTYEDASRASSDYQRMVSPEQVLDEISRGSNIIMMRRSANRLKAQQLQCATDCSVFSPEDLQAKSGPLTGEYWGLPWPCWNDQHPGTPILYRNDIPIWEGGNEFRPRFRATGSTAGNPISDDGVSQLGASYIGPGYDQKNSDGTDGDGWIYEIDADEAFKNLLNQNICPSGAGRARFRAWDLPDPVPVHREPLESPRPDLIDKYPTYDDVTNLYRLPVLYKTIQQQRKNLVNEGYPFILTTGRQVEHMGGGAETRSCHYLVELQPECYAEIHPTVAIELGINHWDWVWVETLRGRCKVRAYVTERVNEGVMRGGKRVEATIFIPYHWAGWFEGQSYANRWPAGTEELAYGDSVNIICVDGYDRSTVMQETKACLCKVYKA
ncbi:MAG: formate dehydrogenase subunit alpha [Methanomicrobia archaeon]|nr:formate dehydrogenase subunit alpha [Methanomicrobia archaeon]